MSYWKDIFKPEKIEEEEEEEPHFRIESHGFDGGMEVEVTREDGLKWGRALSTPEYTAWKAVDDYIKARGGIAEDRIVGFMGVTGSMATASFLAGLLGYSYKTMTARLSDLKDEELIEEGPPRRRTQIMGPPETALERRQEAALRRMEEEARELSPREIEEWLQELRARKEAG